jgi:hypothetical protein
MAARNSAKKREAAFKSKDAKEKHQAILGLMAAANLPKEREAVLKEQRCHGRDSWSHGSS